jgi:LysM repeat protein
MKKIALFVLVFNFFISFSQEKDNVYSGNSESVTEKSVANETEEEFTYHTVKKGETMVLIYKKYLVDPAAIYKLNKEAVDGISEGMILKIPVSKYVKSENQKSGTEKAVVSDVNSENQKSNIQKLYVSDTNKSLSNAPNNGNSKNKSEFNSGSDTELSQKLVHKVEKKETMFSISKKYNIGVDTLLELNPEIKNNSIVVGQQLKVSKMAVEAPQIEIKDVPSPVEISNKKLTVVNSNSVKKITHIVQSKETLYSLSKLYNTTIDSIKNLNPILKSRALQLGQELIIKN